MVLPGQRVARRAVGHGEHQAGVAVEVLGGDEPSGAGRVVGYREPAQHLAGRRVIAPRHVQGPARQPDVARRDLAERGGHQGRRGELAARQHRAVAEEPGEVIAEPPVVRGDHQPQLGAELLRAQRPVEVGEVIRAHQGHGPGRRDAGVGERLAGQRGVLADDDPGQRRDLRPVVPELVGEQHDDVLVVAVA